MRDPKSIALFALSLTCAFLAGAVMFRAGPAQAQQAPSNYGSASVNSNNRFIAATGSVGSGMSVLWVLDGETKRVLVYGTNNLGKSVELRAARNIEWDTKLDEYMDDSQYKAEDLKRLAEKQRGQPQGPVPPPPGPKDGSKPDGK